MFPSWQNVSNTTTSDSLHVGQLWSSITTPQLIAFILGALWLLSFWQAETPTVQGAPVHGRLWRWEPAFWLQSRFTWGARNIITSGYEKYKDRPFVIKRYDVNFTVLPHKYLDELRLVPESKLSASKAQVQNIGHKWTGTDFMAESHLHFRALQNKLSAELPKYLDVAKAELDHVWGIEVPSPQAREIIEPLVEKHTEIVRRKEAGENVDEEDTILNWMKDNGTQDEVVIDKLATRQLVISFASIHTTTAAITNVILDLCTHPEWTPVLREEIEGVVKELRSIDSTQSGTKQWLQRLEKLDSFINESQRMNSILLRKQKLTNTILRSHLIYVNTDKEDSARICWAGADHMNDPLTTPNPKAFDPMRSYQKRHSSSDQIIKHLAGQTSPDNLSFGYGKFACPGRHFAVNEMKLLLARFITQYDFKFPGSITSRPQNVYMDEFAMVDPKVRIMIKLRQEV
ncbi:hypothetical protein FHL15_006858 [Xylaria flabelliformis]|uniref:Cytochrome P450 n=1 Tax=Xylaria flabelliformis TaxID=2512241 RepID=A0A553HWD0_9PEZI|nr:hypothetical protein FHL15_006858 [Xylaria flabelliformis]